MKIKIVKLGQILVDAGLLTEDQLNKALLEQKFSNKRLGQILIDKHYITETQMAHSLEDQMNIPYFDLTNAQIDNHLSSIIPEALAMKCQAIPIKQDGNILTIAVADPMDYNAINDIGTYTKLKIYPVISEPSKIDTKIHELYAARKAYDAAKEFTDASSGKPQEQAAEPDSDENSQPIIRFVNSMIERAAALKASDIHIEPAEKKLTIRFRVDGHLGTYMETRPNIASAVASRIKFIGGMNIAEKRIPQDGRINYRIGDKEIDLRISVLPSVFGEKIVIRITTALGLEMKKDKIGFIPENLRRFDELLKSSHGIILLTGPTGSGKSTTLYTAIKEIIREDISVVTIEDPVEMIIPKITQVQVNDKAGLTFAAVLRSILRQDPDVVMVGEIRDRETAEIATSVAITGHLVLSTLHTYDAPSSIIRLVDMGVAPFMVSAAVIGVISQRLVRTLCPDCKEEYTASEDELKLLGLEPGQDLKLYRKHKGGCEKCHKKGFAGRMAIHEIMPVTAAIKKCINEGENTDMVRHTALREGMIPMDYNLKQIVIDGMTSIDEMLLLNIK